MPSTKRRRFLQAAGIGGVAALVGCIEAAPAEQDGSTPTPTDSGNEGPEDLDPAKSVDVDRIAADPTDVPPPVDWNEPRRHEIELETVEVAAEIEPGVTFDYMTFDGQVPGPILRVRRGDTVHLTLHNPEDSNMPHNIDFHAVYGPGGGAEDTTVNPGESAAIEFRAMYPGVFIYHCAVANLDYHISSGMFGAIIVEPEEGLPPVDTELYFGQHEIYTRGVPGQEGHHAFDMEAMAREEPTYVVYNGEAYGFTPDRHGPIAVDKGERVRVFLSNGGPNFTSAWHAIGNVWDRLYRDGDLYSDPARFVETTPVAPGTVAAAEMDTPVPGPIKLVDHALSRVTSRGLMGVIEVEGDPEPDIFNPEPS
ncbi:MAG: copper-containing nitrite reductase [Halobacteriales archaeon]